MSLAAGLAAFLVLIGASNAQDQQTGSADIAAGRVLFNQCRACHSLTDGGRRLIGPSLDGLFGRTAGGASGYAYSRALKEADFTWDADKLDDWLQNPKTFLPGNKMSYVGLRDAQDRRNLIAYLQVALAKDAKAD